MKIMKNIKSIFTDEENEFITKNTGIELNDEHDYSSAELLELYETFEDGLPYDYDNKTGMPLESAQLFESIIDKCSDF